MHVEAGVPRRQGKHPVARTKGKFSLNQFDLCDSSMNPKVASLFFVERQHAAFNTSTAAMATFDKMQQGYGADVVEEVAAHALGFALKGHGL